MKKYMLLMVLILTWVAAAGAGELKKDYFIATQPGSWAQYRLETSDGTKAVSSSQREPDVEGRVAVEEGMKIVAGLGAGTESKNSFVLDKKFNLARDWLSFGKCTEKMRMKAGNYDMPVDANTLAAIKKGAKDFRGAVTFEVVETVDGHACDRYAYAIVIAGPAPSKETGQVWLDATVPFGIVRQVAKSFNADGSMTSSFEIRLQDTGRVQQDTVQVASPAKATATAAPAVTSLMAGYKAGRLGLEVSVVPGSNGRQLLLALVNKTDAELKVKLEAGAQDIPASSPIGALKIVVKRAAELVVPAGDSSDAINVDQQPGRGALEGKFVLSVYEGTQLFSGSVTRGTVPGK